LGITWASLASVFKSSCKCTPSQKQVTASRPGLVCDLVRQSVTATVAARLRQIRGTLRQLTATRPGGGRVRLMVSQVAVPDHRDRLTAHAAAGVLTLSRGSPSPKWATHKATVDQWKMKRLFRKRWLHARGQKQAENASFCVTDRRETKSRRASGSR
jgi:hypothetical protein